MKRLALTLSAVVVGVVVSSCAVGVRGPAIEITQTSATLTGSVLSTTGGPGSWHFEYGTTEARTERTPSRAIDFEVGTLVSVSEPVEGLEPGTIYHFAVCAEDSENPGDPFCSPERTFRTQSDIRITMTKVCSSYPPDHGMAPSVSGLPPKAEFRGTLSWPTLGTAGATFIADENGSYNAGTFTDPAAGTWTVTVEFEGQTVTRSLFVDCAEPTPT
jgi:hypothetical protein